MEQLKTWATDLFFGSLGGIYISIALFLGNMYNQMMSYSLKSLGKFNHEDIEFWYKLGTSAIIFVLVVWYHIKRIREQNKKHKHEVATSSYFDAYIIAGDDLRKVKQYELALSRFNKALELNFDNETAQAKINEINFLIDAAHK